MKYFKKGLTKEELHKEYRRLAKIHHPDMGGDTEVMKAINHEYDKYFENQYVTPEMDMWEAAYAAYTARKAAQSEREFIVFMMFRNGMLTSVRQPSNYLGLPRVDHPSREWKDACEGFARVRYSRSGGLVGNHIKVQLPNDGMLSDLMIKEASKWGLGFVKNHLERHKIYAATVGDSEFYIDDSNNIYAVDSNGQPFLYSLYGGSQNGIKKELVGSTLDFIFKTYQDCTYEEFELYHDVNNQSEFHDVLQMRPTDALFSDNPTVSYMVRKGAIKVFVSRLDFTLKYGYFDIDKLIPILKNVQIEDIEDAQDELDRLHDEFQAKVKAKIRKGKIKVVI